MAEEIICNKLKYVRCHYATNDCVCTHADAKDDFCPMGKTISAGKPGTAKKGHYMKTITKGLRLSTEVVEAVEAEARAKRWSFNRTVQVILEEWAKTSTPRRSPPLST